MKNYLSQLKPHPEFEQAVMDALAISNEQERSEEVKRVLSWYGTMFVTSVELGGMKHSTVEKFLDEKVRTRELATPRVLTFRIARQPSPQSSMI